jgi:molybdopterin converting factor small subunit
VIRLCLPTALLAFVPDDQARERRSQIVLTASSWPEAVEEIRHRFPLLAGHVFGDERERTAEGFVLVVNGDVAHEGRPDGGLQPGDEILFLPQIAGG